MLFPPKAYIIGAQKAGTSSLAGLLSQHPAISLGQRKEIHFFSTNWDKGLDWYQAQFTPKPGTTILLDASTSYSEAPIGPHTPEGYEFRADRLKIPERMAQLRPDARLIYIVRDPVERIYSSYWQAVRAGYETRPLDVAVREDPEYVYGSLYYTQLQHYLRSFDRDAILLLNFKDIERDLATVGRKCLSFLGAEPANFEFPETRARNVGFRYNVLGHAIRKLAGSERSLSRLTGALRDRLPRSIYDALGRVVSKPMERMNAETRSLLEPWVADDYRRLQAFTGMSFD